MGHGGQQQRRGRGRTFLPLKRSVSWTLLAGVPSVSSAAGSLSPTWRVGGAWHGAREPSCACVGARVAARRTLSGVEAMVRIEAKTAVRRRAAGARAIMADMVLTRVYGQGHSSEHQYT